MKKYEKEVHKALLNDEQDVIDNLKDIYNKALNDINEKIALLLGRNDTENLQSIIYQVEYQKALKSQINAILDEMNTSQFTTISEYLTKSYEGGYLGAMYSIHKQGIPIISPINQKSVVRALQLESKLSKSLYESLGVDVNQLKKSIRTQISRGIANNYSYQKIAQELANETKIGLNKSIRIARTEGHRIQVQSQLDASEKAKEKGANVVKQWDSSLDGRTRPTHRKLDGQIRELDEMFEVNGFKAKGPGGFGVPHMDINCRCSVNTRARWGLDEDELEELKKRADYFGLDKTDDFEDFKKKYLNAANEPEMFKTPIKPEVIDYSKAASGNAALSEDLRKKVQMTEQINYASQKEHATIYDKNGNVVFENSGEPNRVYVEDDKVKGNILTHNHPNTSRLSNADIKNHIMGSAYQTRATTVEGNVFSLTTIDESKLVGIDIDEFTNELNKIDGSIFSKGIKRNSKEHMDYLNEQLGEKYGIKFDVENCYGRIEEFTEPTEMMKKLKIKPEDLTNNGNSTYNGIKEKYVAVKTVEEAKKYATEVLKLDFADYDTFNVDCVNMVNKELTELYNIFGDIHASGHLKGIRHYTKPSKWYAAYSPIYKEVYLKNMTNKTALKKMLETAKYNYDVGFWSSNSAEHAIRHEVGHAIQHWFTDNDVSKLNRISQIRDAIKKKCGITVWSQNDTREHLKAAGDIISYYALYNDGELIAESVAEYMTGNPRDTAKEVVEILLGRR